VDVTGCCGGIVVRSGLDWSDARKLKFQIADFIMWREEGDRNRYTEYY
jgi:hypothetical protein